jgi:hypothetical protein
MGSWLILLAFALATCLSVRLSAQELSGTKGGLAGVVADSSGAAVPGAGVACLPHIARTGGCLTMLRHLQNEKPGTETSRAQL